MRYGSPISTIRAVVSAPRPMSWWRDAINSAGGLLVDAATEEALSVVVLESKMWAASIVECAGGQTITLAAPRSASHELDAYRRLLQLIGAEPEVGTPSSPILRERYRPRMQVELSQCSISPPTVAALQKVSPGLVRIVNDAAPDAVLLDGPDSCAGSIVVNSRWVLGAPDGVTLLAHSDDPVTHYPLAIRRTDDGRWCIDYAIDAVDVCHVQTLKQQLEMVQGPEAPEVGTVHERIAKAIERHGDRTAVRDSVSSVTYRELDHKSAALASELVSAGCRRGDIVGLHLPQGVDAVIAMVAVMRVGAAYAPLDCDFPLHRLAEVIDRSQPAVVVTRGLGDLEVKTNTVVLQLDTYPEVDPQLIPWAPVSTLDALFVLFTSGSTGRPKGVVQTVGPLSAVIESHRRTWSGPGVGTVMQFATLNFDVATQEILCALGTGQCLVVPPQHTRKDPAALAKFMLQEEVSDFFCPQVLLQEVCRAALASHLRMPMLRHIYQSGEPLVMNHWIDQFFLASPRATLHNHYGPTETHLLTAWPLPRRRQPGGPVALGPLSVAGVGKVLDSTLAPVPNGVVGELYSPEPQAGRGYLGDPGLTAARFVADPRGDGRRMYRTGDMVCKQPDGSLRFVGRSDDQAKVRGHRVEPEEVTARILELREVANAGTMVVRGEDTEARLESVVASASDPDACQARVRDHLRAVLPDYLVPSRITVVRTIPRTATGKIDRRAVLGAQPDPVRPDDPVRAVVGEILGCTVDADADFFSLGGTSITAIYLARALESAFQTHVSVRDVLAHPEMKELSAVITDRIATKAPAARLPELTATTTDMDAPFGLLDQQQAYLIGRDPQFDGGDVACHLYLEYRGAADAVCPDRLQEALQSVVDRHLTMRTVFDTQSLTQRVLEPSPRVAIDVIETDDCDEAVVEVRQRLSHEQREFGTFPLFSVVVVRDNRSLCLCISLDSLLVDARSTKKLLTDWEAAYRGDQLPEWRQLPSFRDYVRAVEGAADLPDRVAERQRAQDYWRSLIPQMPSYPELPDGAGVVGQPTFVNRRHVIAAETWDRVKSHARLRGLTPNGVLLGAYAASIAQWAARPRFLLNVPRFAREMVHPDVDDIVGEFASFVLLDVDTSDCGSFVELAHRVQRRLTDDLEHQALSGMEVLRELVRHRGSLSGPAAPVVFTSELGVGDEIGRLFDGRLTQQFAVSQTPQVWLDMIVGEEQQALIVRGDVVEGQFPDDVIDGIFQLFLLQIHALTEDASWVEPPLSAVDPAEAVRRGNGAEVLPTVAVLAGIEAGDQSQVVLIDGEIRWTRAQLSEHIRRNAGAVASQMRSDDERPVAIVAPPGAATTAKILGTVLSGHTYLPIDAELPSARVRDMLKSVPVAGELDEEGTQTWIGDPAPSPTRVAVLFTSGSTGTPKGVPVPMAGVQSCMAETIAMTGLCSADVSLALARPHHDLSMFDMFAVLGAGGSVVYPQGNDPSQWPHLVQQHGVTAVCAVPAAIDMLIDGAVSTGQRLEKLRVVLTGGDRVPPELASRLASVAPAAQMWSIGGPTETTAWNIAYPVTAQGIPAGWDSVPYGRPFPGTCYRVVDSEWRDRPPRAIGEMVVSGPGVMDGYLGTQVAENGLAVDPLTGQTYYRTGDLGAFRDGLLQFCGRADRQVEIRGQRVEPGEVESVIASVAGVTAVAVVPIRDGHSVRGLAAFVTGHAGRDAIDVATHTCLPRHEIPRRMEFLEQLPVNRAGKIDRLVLEAWAVGAGDPERIASDPLEILIADIWAEELRLDTVPPTATFLAVGGDSVSGFKLLVAMRAIFGAEVPVSIRELLDALTVAELAERLRKHARATEFESIARMYDSLLTPTN